MSRVIPTRGALGSFIVTLRDSVVVRESLVVWLVAMVLLIPGMSWGIPMATGPAVIRGWDVDGVGGVGVLSELSHLTGGDVRGWYVAYPLFHYLVQGVLYAPYMAWLVATGGLDAPSAVYPFGLQDPVGVIARLHLLTRVLAIVMAAGAVAMAYATVRRRGGRIDAMVTALVVLLAEPLIFYAHTGNLDIPVLFWSAAAICAAGLALEQGITRANAVVVGLLAGTAIATKDQAYAIMVPSLAYLALRGLRSSAAEGRIAQVKNIGIMGAAATSAFLVAGGVVFWPRRFVMHVRYMLDFEQSFANVRHPTYLTQLRAEGMAGVPDLARDLVHAVAESVGIPILVIAALALVVAIPRSPLQRLVLVGVVGTFVLSILPIRHMQYRYALFPVWALAVGLGAAGTSLRGMRAGWRALWYGAVAVALCVQGVRAVDVVVQQRRDARYAAGDWASTHMVRGDEIGYFGGTHQLPHLPAGVLPHWLFGEDPSAVRMVYERQFRWMVVAADYFSAESRDHSAIMPDSVWRDLTEGRAGYRLAARFETPSLIGRAPYFLPYLNSPVRIFERVAPPTAPRRERSEAAPPF